MEPHLKLQLWSPSCSDADGWIINQTHHSEAALENHGLSALHSCHTHYVPPRRKDVHGPMVRGPTGPFSVQTEKKHFVRPCQRIPSTLACSFSGAEELNSDPDYFNKTALNPAGKSHLEKFGVPRLLLLHQ